ncbi:MAG: radical SAM protein [Bacteroidaceae bacterium]|nr:radical SAM protein [Bacteroidaceae bacterium]
MMKINETFVSLQGEGHFTGTPAFFLRLSGCNLQCPFCDTQHQTFIEMSEDEIVQEASREKPRHIVITGGEPALQLTQSLVDKLHEAGFFIQVETNGTLPLPQGIDWVTCSPKSLTPALSKGEGVQTVDELKVLFMGDGTDPEEMVSPILGEGTGVRLFLQPLDTGDEMRNRIILRDTIAYILQHPKWSLSLQTHKMLGIK